MRSVIALSLLILALPPPQAAQSRTAAERMAAIEGAQAAAGANGLGALRIRPWGRLWLPRL